ncbi:hypothetical protein KPH14_010778 [Odynerus spinipes]|uniref:Tim44-like domain-containing protein n=1 Tax=Odynerus spinipes TaxID=1348599 RepID=A0AAD9RGY8_9HYME|nr:hypothetical protein KPH14_010778 [Odynerus spinipes]
MLSSIIRRSATRAKLHRFYVSLACDNYTLATNQCRSKVLILQCITLKPNIIPHRNFDNGNAPILNFLPLLPGSVERVKPILADISIFFIERFALNPVIDPNFKAAEVAEAAKSAASRVSIELANQNYEALTGLVEETALILLKAKIDKLIPQQRKFIAIREEDIISCTPSWVKVIVKSYYGEPKVFRIVVDMHLIIIYKPLYGRKVEKDDVFEAEHDPQTIPSDLVANYIFSREYTESEGSDWDTCFYLNLINSTMS